jgi:hypothetical protein
MSKKSKLEICIWTKRWMGLKPDNFREGYCAHFSLHGKYDSDKPIKKDTAGEICDEIRTYTSKKGISKYEAVVYLEDIPEKEIPYWKRQLEFSCGNFIIE